MKLVEMILDKYERSRDWQKEKEEGCRTMRWQEYERELHESRKAAINMGPRKNGRAAVLSVEEAIRQKEQIVGEAVDLERRGLVKIKWISGYYGKDFESVKYELKAIEKLYQMADRVPKKERWERQKDRLETVRRQIRSGWMRKYLDSQEEWLTKGNVLEEEKEEWQNLFYRCLIGLDQLRAPVFKRIFSKRILGGSKIFESRLQTKVVSVARKYHDGIDENMSSAEVLSQLFIEEYSQELHIKGNLRLRLEGRELDLSNFRYGAVLNYETLKRAELAEVPEIKRILTIENKANYMSKPYEKGTLIIFCHGYFTPVEREFLVRLRCMLEQHGKELIYQHSGDLDYGGICIFRYIRKRIFPELKPYRMDVETFERYFSLAEEVEPGKLEKLKSLEEPEFKELIDRIVRTGRTLEQEAYL